MAVGCAAPDAPAVTAGHTEAFAEVRGTAIIKPLLPVAVAPGDTFEGALVIANTVPGSGPEARARLDLTFGPGLEARDAPAQRTLVIPENGETAVPLPLRALDVPGISAITATVTLGDAPPVRRTVEVSIRPATPRTLTISEAVVDERRDITVPSELYPWQAVTRATLATGSLPALRAVFARLDATPYDGAEQRISQAFPHVALSVAPPELRELVLPRPPKDPGEGIEDAARRRSDAAIQGIRRCFRPGDGVSFWPGGKSDDFLTA